ncbi:MAG: IS256 family transposase [Rhodocyclaceae bacterium]|nr:IS256 family transposase [Rhodocyclaceae bacterium]
MTEQVKHVDLGTLFRGAVKAALELVLEEELREIVGAGRYARSATRVDSRNGSFMRGLLTSLGHIEVTVPRSRSSGSPVDVIGRYARRLDEVNDAIVSAYVNGVSTRGMGKVTEALMGANVGRSTVSRVTQRLEKKVEDLRNGKIESRFAYLFLDATFVPARWARAVESVSALVAYGVDEDGKRQLLAVEMGVAEDEDSWSKLLAGLVERGLDGVRLIISDAHKGLWAAARRHFPEVAHQRCVVHLMRNVGSNVPHRLRKRVLGQVSSIFAAKNPADAKKRLEKFVECWSKDLPEAVECLKTGFKAAAEFFAFPKAHWARIRSNNGLERLNREIKRRTKKVGAFPDRASALRLITAVAVDVTETWSKRRYLDMSLLDQ